jgi:hypothetical protein
MMLNMFDQGRTWRAPNTVRKMNWTSVKLSAPWRTDAAVAATTKRGRFCGSTAASGARNANREMAAVADITNCPKLTAGSNQRRNLKSIGWNGLRAAMIATATTGCESAKTTAAVSWTSRDVLMTRWSLISTAVQSK